MIRLFSDCYKITNIVVILWLFDFILLTGYNSIIVRLLTDYYHVIKTSDYNEIVILFNYYEIMTVIRLLTGFHYILCCIIMMIIYYVILL